MSDLPIVVASNRLQPQVAARLEQVAVLRMPSGDAPMAPALLRAALKDASAFIGFMTDSIDAAWLAQAPALRLVAAALKGYDNYDVPACTAAGVWLTIVPDLLTEPTAELAIGLAIGLARNIADGDALVRCGQFRGWRPILYGKGLAGSVVGIVGVGRVGRAILDRLAGFQVAQVLGVDPSASDPRAVSVDLAHALATADFLFLATPITAGTRHLIDANALRASKPGQHIINVGRGSVVDEEAIAAALEAGRIGGYAADVFEFEDWALSKRPDGVSQALLRHPRTLLTPHLGSAVAGVRLAIEHRAVDNALAVLNGQVPPDAINAPVLR